MDRNRVVTLHRRRADQHEDRMITQGPSYDVVRQYRNIRSANRLQYSMMDGGMYYNYLDIENIARQMDMNDV
jgi:hypothetical protein